MASTNIPANPWSDPPVRHAPMRWGSTGPAIVVNYPHHEIHGGNMFIVSYKTPDTDALADDGTIDLHLAFTTDKDAHAVFQVHTGGDAEVLFFESPTVATSDGVDMTPINMNRGSTNAGFATVTRNPTVSSDGTQLLNIFVPGGTFLSGGGQSQLRDNTEWVLGRGGEYMVRLINRAGSAQPACVEVQWYEEGST